MRSIGVLVLGMLFGSMVGSLRAQEPEVCNEELLEDYALREELIFDLMMQVRECRWRYGGCAPDSTWVMDYTNSLWLASHPEVVRSRSAEVERWEREQLAAIQALEAEER